MNKSTSCDMTETKNDSDEIKKILESSKTIAVVGLSKSLDKDSYRVASYLKEHGYRIIPVNPAEEKIPGEKSYPDLKSIPEKIDIVDIFRKVEFIPGIVEEAIKAGAKTVWMQLGLAHNDSAEKAIKSGLNVVQSKCLKIEHSRLIN